METQKVILPFFYALFHAGFSSEETRLLLFHHKKNWHYIQN